MKHSLQMKMVGLISLFSAAYLPTFAQVQDASAQRRQESAPAVEYGVKRSVASKILSEARPFWVYLPLSYEGAKDRRYPVLYVLDGDAHFQWVCGLVRFMSEINGNFIIPEL